MENIVQSWYTFNVEFSVSIIYYADTVVDFREGVKKTISCGHVRKRRGGVTPFPQLFKKKNRVYFLKREMMRNVLKRKNMYFVKKSCYKQIFIKNLCFRPIWIFLYAYRKALKKNIFDGVRKKRAVLGGGLRTLRTCPQLMCVFWRLPLVCLFHNLK